MKDKFKDTKGLDKAYMSLAKHYDERKENAVRQVKEGAFVDFLNQEMEELQNSMKDKEKQSCENCIHKVVCNFIHDIVNCEKKVKEKGCEHYQPKLPEDSVSTSKAKVFDILDKMEFFQGQRAGRELWNDKPKEVQDQDLADFVRDIKYIRSYLKDSVVLSREEYEKKKKHLQNVLELSSFQLENVVKENEKLKEQLKDKKLLTEENYNKLCHLAYFGYDDAYEKGSKETAEKILKWLKGHLSCMGFSIVEAYFKEQFGVEIKE